MTSTTYQIHLELSDTKPKVWRRLLVPSDIRLSDLHKIIQTAMGWTNSHLHHFIKGREFYEPPAPEDLMWDGSFGTDYTGLKISDFLKKKNDVLDYEYDFGDGWHHRIKLEEVIQEDKPVRPVCTAGAMACPPEDCGGVWGFEEFKQIMKNSKHPEYEDYVEWYGGVFDPEAFDKDAVNKLLKKKNYGVLEW